MSETQNPGSVEVDEPTVPAVGGMVSAYPFGPEFFLIHLKSFVRDRCPTPEESLPLVEIHLSDGSVLDLCHVIAVTVRWLALAVREDSHGDPQMKMHTALVPYQMILRVTVRSRPADSTRLGFDVTHDPHVDTACQGDSTAPECQFLPSKHSTGGPHAPS